MQRNVGKRKHHNDGMTLIEVIVSMLILAIISVPLLSSFLISSNMQAKTRQKQYALIVAQNVMEGIKYAGIEDTALSFNQVAGKRVDQWMTGLKSPVYGIGFYEADSTYAKLDKTNTVQAQLLSVKNESGTYVYQTTSDKKSYYVLNQIAEGTKEFDVQIIVDGSGYTGDATVRQNNFPIPAITNLDMTKTALINPNGAIVSFLQNADGTYVYDTEKDSYGMDASHAAYDELAIAYFKEKNEQYCNEQWKIALRQTKNRYEADCDAAKRSGTATPAPYPSPQPKNTLTTEQIKAKIVRETILTIKDSGSDPATSSYLVNAALRYTYDQSSEQVMEDDDCVKQYTGFYSDRSFNELEDVYLFHQPLSASGYQHEKSDRVIVRNLSVKSLSMADGDRIGIFIAEQPIENSYDKAGTIYVSMGDSITSERIRFYYYNTGKTEKKLASADWLALNTENYQNVLVTDQAPEQRICQVTVRVYAHGESELLYETTSAVLK